MPITSPANVSVFRSSFEPSIIHVTWQLFTLVEARGFIEYIVQLHHLPRQAVLTVNVLMDQSSVVFMNLDPTANFVAKVGTVSRNGEIILNGPGKQRNIV